MQILLQNLRPLTFQLQLLSLAFIVYGGILASHMFYCSSPIHPFSHLGWNNELLCAGLLCLGSGSALWQTGTLVSRHRKVNLYAIVLTHTCSLAATLIFFRFFYPGFAALASLSSLISLQESLQRKGPWRIAIALLSGALVLTLNALLLLSFSLVGK